tara:strand:- start:1895 stop:4069 length:2175 start_codon:yes stop_codon:yes gene_type:complete
MSFVITSNKKDDDELENYSSDNSRPYNYTNTLSNTITLPANAQIALQSCKINLDGSISIGNAARVFYFYFGQTIDSPITGVDATGFPVGVFDQTGSAVPSVIGDMNYSTAKPIRIELFEEHISQGIDRVSVNELCLEIEKSLNFKTYHPQLAGRWTVVSKLDASTKAFQGFTIKCNQGITVPGSLPLTNFLPPTKRVFLDGSVGGGMIDTIKFADRLEANATNREYNYSVVSVGGADVGRFTFGTGARSAKTSSVIGNVPPIAMKHGVFRTVIAGVIKRDLSTWQIGLTRALNTEPGVTGPINNYCNPPYFRNNTSSGRGDARGDMKNLVDYVFGCDARTGILTVHQAVPDERAVTAAKAAGVVNSGLDRYRRLYMKKFPYAEVGTIGGIAPLPANYDLDANTLNITHMNMFVDGEVVTIQAEDATGPTFYDVVRYDSSRNKELNLKPINQSCWSLYPYLSGNNFFNQNGFNPQNIDIATYTGINGTPLQAEHRLWSEKAGVGTADQSYSWEQQMIKLNQIPQIQNVNQRRIQDIGIGRGAPLIVSYTTINDNTAPYEYRLDYDGAVGTGNVPTLILSEDSRYPDTSGANCQALLGYDRVPVVDYNYFSLDGDGKGWTAGSSSLPNGVSTRSIFVRVNNLTQKSINAFKDLKSGIIGHLPRFDGLNNVGPLYLENNNLVYIDIDNPAPLKLNELSISLVYSDETYCEALTGTTIVCLHIKAKGE